MIDGVTDRVSRSATSSASPTQATAARIADDHGDVARPRAGSSRQSTIAVAIAPGPATSGVASGTSATSSASPVGKSVPRSISSARAGAAAAGDREALDRDVR